MIRHVVLFRFRSGLSPERREAFHAAASSLAERVPAITACVGGPALRLQAGAFDYVLMLDLADANALRRYKDHDAHRALIEEQIRPCVEESVRIQVEF